MRISDWSSDVCYSDLQVLRALNDLGVAGMLVPEEHGGLGMPLLDAAVVAEQLGYAVAPVPFLASQVLAPIALRDARNDEQKAHCLPKIASGEARIGVALSETIEVRDGAGVSSVGGKLTASTEEQPSELPSLLRTPS